MNDVRNHLTLTKRSKVTREEIYRNGKLKTILYIWSSKREIFPSGELMKHKACLCAHGGMQQWGMDYWETYSPVVYWIKVITLLDIASIHDLPTECIDFVLMLPQDEFYIDVYMYIPIGMEVDDVSQKCKVININIPIYGLKQSLLNRSNLLSGAQAIASLSMFFFEIRLCSAHIF